MNDDLEKKCLRYELGIMRKVDHYRVLRTYEIYEGENHVYCLCDYYEGENLHDSIILKGSQPEKKTLTIIM